MTFSVALLRKITPVFKNLRALDIAVILILSLVGTLMMYKGWYIRAHGDIFPLFNAPDFFTSGAFASFWIDSRGTGEPAFLDPANIPYQAAWALALGAGISPVVFQLSETFVLYAVSGASMWLLVSRLVPEPHWTPARLTAAVLYMFIPIFSSGGQIPGFAILYAWTPLFLWLLARGLERRDRASLAIIALATVLVAPGGTNIPAYAILVILLGAYGVFHIFYMETDKEARWASVRFLGLLGVLALLTNAFWLTAFASSLWITDTGATLAGLGTQDQLDFASKQSSFANVLQLSPFTYDFFLPQFYPAATYYGQPWVRLANFAVPAFAMGSLLLVRRDSPAFRYVLFFVVLLLVSAFAAKALHAPFGGFTQWIYDSFPPINAFRAPWKLFGRISAVALPVLIAFSVSRASLMSVPSLRVRSLVYGGWMLVATSIAVVAWPGISGMGFLLTRGETPGHFAEIPDYWFELVDILNRDPEDSRIFLLPMDGHSLAYNWEIGYWGIAREGTLFNSPVLRPRPSGLETHYYGTSETVEGMIATAYASLNNVSNLAKVLGLFNVRYVVQRNDLDWTYFGGTDLGSPEFIEGALQNQPELSQPIRFGELDLYRIANSAITPRVMASTDVIPLASVDDPDGVIPVAGLTRTGNRSIEGIQGEVTADEGVTRIASRSTHSGSSTTVLFGVDDVNPAEFPYLRVRLKTGEHAQTGVLIRLKDKSNIWLDAVNPPEVRVNNHYESPDWTTFVFDLGSIREPISRIGVVTTHRLEPAYVGPLEVWVGDVSFAREIGGVRTILSTVQSEAFTPGATLLVAKQDLARVGWQEPRGDAAPSVAFDKVNDSTYRLRVQAEEPFMVYLGATYNQSWKAYLGDVGPVTSMFQAPVSDENHFVANSFGNGWYIDETGDVTITIMFEPQSLFVISWWISGIVILGMILYLMNAKRTAIRLYSRVMARGR